eukprot:563632_1
MACACPCFGDEADAEEKPNQMIQLDGLGMLRLDTQHVGQGSQGMRSAKWFYFGETDNRLAVVNLLLCITCLMMWMLAISVAYPYICGANPSDTTNDPAPPNKTNDLGPPNAAIDSNKNQRSDGNHSKRGQGEQSNAGADDYKEKYDIAIQKIGRQTESHQTKIANLKESHEQEITNLKASHERVKTDKTKFRKALDDIQEALDYKTAELADLPEMIRESKKETEKKREEMQENYDDVKPFYDQLLKQFKCQAIFDGYDVECAGDVGSYIIENNGAQKAMYEDWVKANDLKKKQSATTNDEFKDTTNVREAERELNDKTTDAMDGSDAGHGGANSDN